MRIALTVALFAAASAHAQMGQRQMHGVRDDIERSYQQHRQPPAMRELVPQRTDAPEPSRMSPAERRQLRRDIDDAGREIYRRNPQRPVSE